jgi:hypothetical protein
MNGMHRLGDMPSCFGVRAVRMWIEFNIVKIYISSLVHCTYPILSPYRKNLRRVYIPSTHAVHSISEGYRYINRFV